MSFAFFSQCQHLIGWRHAQNYAKATSLHLIHNNPTKDAQVSNLDRGSHPCQAFAALARYSVGHTAETMGKYTATDNHQLMQARKNHLLK